MSSRASAAPSSCAAPTRLLGSCEPCRAFKCVCAGDLPGRRTPSSASPRSRCSESTSARESPPRTSLQCTHRRPTAAVAVAAARALRAPLSADPPRPARSARGTARGSGTARDPGRVGRRHRTVAPATRPGHHRAARRCRRARPEAPHGPGRRSTPRGGAPGREARRSGPASSAISHQLVGQNSCAGQTTVAMSHGPVVMSSGPRASYLRKEHRPG